MSTTHTESLAIDPAKLPTDEERTMLRDSVRGLLEQHWPAEHAATWAVDGEQVAAIERRLAELGLGALGSDLTEGGTREILIVAEELGRAACPSQLPAAMLAQRVLRAALPSIESPLRALLDGLADGGARAAFALAAFDGDLQAGTVTAADGRLHGTLAFVEGAAAATHLLVALAAPSAGTEAALAIVDITAPGLTLTPTVGMNVPPLARLTLNDTPAVVVPMPAATLADLQQLARLIAAARAYGAARRAFDLVVDYAKERRQFGQPIGRFQAIQHKLADGLIALDGVRLTLHNAATAHDLGSADWRFYAAAAFAFASSGLREVSLQTHHTFGAIGYSEEHEAPRHFRRVHADTTRFGGARRAREDLAALLLDGAGRNLPEYDLGPAGNAFRAEVRQWLADRWAGVYKAEHDALPFHQRRGHPDFSAELGRQGWLALSWPKEFDGQARTPLEQLAFAEEFQIAGVPKPGGEIQGHALMRFGTPEQQAQYLPGIRAGTARFCLGYSEPAAGSDLASLKTSAVRDEATGEWVINGQKLWTTFAEDADYMWLAARTDPEAKPPHAGISVFIVPMKSPGITVRPSMALYGHTFCTEFLDNVRVPASALVGEVNEGWKIITAALATERVQMGGFVAHARANFERLLHEVRQQPGLRDSSAVRERIGTLAAEIEVARQLLTQSVTMVERGLVPVHEAAMSKAFTGELMERVGEAALDLLGAGAALSEGAPGALTNGKLEQMLRQAIMMVIGGGTAEIQRTLIAQRGLELPR